MLSNTIFFFIKELQIQENEGFKTFYSTEKLGFFLWSKIKLQEMRGPSHTSKFDLKLNIENFFYLITR